MVGMVFLHLVVNGQHQLVRRRTLATLEASAALFPEIVNQAAISALSSFLSSDKSSSNTSSAEDTGSASRIRDRLAIFCLASFASGDSCEEQARKSSLVNFAVLAHHPAVGTFVISQSLLSFILTTCQGASPGNSGSNYARKLG